jgi:predicted dehydrogenase
MGSIVKFKSLNYDELISVEQEPIDVMDRPNVENKYRKLLFFILREGIYRTINKIKSKTKNELEPVKKCTLITIKKDGKLFVNSSIQTTDDTEKFVVRNTFIEQKTSLKIDEIVDKSIFNQFVDHPSNKNGISMSRVSEETTVRHQARDKGVFIYGLGDYSRVYIAQNIRRLPKLFCVDYSFPLAKYYKEEFGYESFGIIPEDSYEALSEVKKPLVIIATYHSDHTRIAKEIFDINPNTLIFIEKPPCVTLEDINTLVGLYDQNAQLEIGYNRRYIPINQQIRSLIYEKQKVITFSVKEILINESHWYFWENQGTRITGNLTHWIDLAVFWINGSPVEINLINSPAKDETIAVSILFSEGSLINITVSDKGNSLRGVQEHIEIRTKDETYHIEDFIKLTRIKSDGTKVVKRSLKRIKGHDLMYKHLTKVYQGTEEVAYSKKDLVNSALTTFYVSKMYKEGIRNLKIDTNLIPVNNTL